MKSIAISCFKTCVIITAASLCAPSAGAQRAQQKLGRGVVAVYGTSTGRTGVEITWRRLAQEPENALYNIYTSATRDGAYSKLNAEPLSLTNYRTDLSKVPYGTYIAVSLCRDGADTELSEPFLFDNKGMRNIYMEISYEASPLTMANYSTKFVWPCDLDGNGEYDYVVDRCPVDGSLNYFVEGYLADGTFLWCVDLGVNEKPCDGQNDNMCAYDIDCDGYGELIVQTSDGTRFWDKDNNTWGKYLFGKDDGDSDGDGIIDYNSQTTKNPPRYMTVVDGMTGSEKASAEFVYDDAYNRTNKAQLMGDEYNKHEAHVGIFYHDGIHPAVCGEWLSRDTSKQHHYRNCAFAFDFDAKGNAGNWHQLFHENIGGAEFHMIRIFDADGDGRDEMSSGAYVMDHDGSTLYNTGISHGDRHRTGDIDPEHPGMETFSIQQNAPDMLGMILFDASNGDALKKWYLPAVGDVGRGECIDIDPDHLGYEMFSTMDDYQVYDAQGNKIEGKKGYFPTEGLWWDGNLDRENVNSPDGNGYNAMIVDYTGGRLIEMAKESGWTLKTSFGKRGKYWGDIIGDWREELVLIREVDGVCKGIVGFTTDYPTDIDNIYCLQQDPHYRGDCTTRGYYQTPYPAFYLGYGMPRPQLPPCMVADESTDVFGIADGDRVISPRGIADNVYAMPVKGQTLTLSAAPKPEATLWKGQAGMLCVATDLDCRLVVSEGTVRLDGGKLNTVDLRARGTVAGHGVIDSIALEGALNHEGGRLKPDGAITFAKDLTVDRRTFIEITHPGTDRVEVSGAFAVSAPLVFSFGTVPSPGEYALLTYGAKGDIDPKDITARGLTGTDYEIIVNDGQISLTVNAQRKPAENVRWTGAESNTWDFLAKNFSLNDVATGFVEGDGVVFGDDAVCTDITVSEMMPVTTATFVNNDKVYTISGKGGIDGRTLLKSGTLKVKELNYNFEIDRAHLIVDNTNASYDNPMVINDTATIEIPAGTLAAKGKISGDGVLRKTGAGQLNITYGSANSWAATILENGTLAMGTWKTTIGTSSSPVYVTGNATFVVFNNNSTSEVPTVQNTFAIGKDCTLTFHAGKRCSIKGKLTGEGTCKIDFPYVRGDVYTNMSEFAGTYHVTTENCRFVQAINLQQGTLFIDKGAAVVSVKAGSGSEQNLTHKVGTLSGNGTLGNGTWNVSTVRYAQGATTVAGTLNLAEPTIDVTAINTSKATEASEYPVFTITGKVNISGTVTMIPAVPAEGLVWDTSTLATDGVLRVKAQADDIADIANDSDTESPAYDLLGRPAQNPALGLSIRKGRKSYKR